ncbi:MAG: NADH-quinone oxidoreductase subunit NuoH [Planctomycetota bacterium]
MDKLATLFGGGVIGDAVALVASILIVVGFITVYAMFAIWLERKASADFQSRLGPMRVGAHGWAQSIADGLKLAFKEDIIPADADKFLFWIAPAVVFAGALATFVAIPVAAGWQVVDLNIGLFYILAIASTGVIGVIMAGWASNNKWSLYGAMREAAQLVSYEIPSGLALLVPILVVGSFRLQDIVEFQARHTWLLFYSPFTLIAFIIYYIASLAECKRAPFDLPEAESELVSGFHTEYSGLRFSFFFLEEYAMMFVVSAIATTLFLGGWQPLPFVSFALPGAAAAAIFIAKCVFLVWVQMWVRWTLPRLRVDQVMTLGYKYLVPFAFLALVGIAIYVDRGWQWIPGIF